MAWWWLVALTGCAPTHQVSLTDALTWEFEARPTSGVVDVLPLFGPAELPPVARDTFLGSELSWWRLERRRLRTEQLAQVPAAVAKALPEAVGRTCAHDLQFQVGDLRARDRNRIELALQGRQGLGAALADVAGRRRADATLFVWVDALGGEPVSARGFPGDIVRTLAGPVVVDHEHEPYRVSARIGVALVANDGEVVIRYADTYDALLIDDQWAVGRDLAESVARELHAIWPSDPRLALAEPSRL